MTDDDSELDRIVQNTNLDKFKLIDLPLEQLVDLSQNNMGIGMAHYRCEKYVRAGTPRGEFSGTVLGS